MDDTKLRATIKGHCILISVEDADLLMLRWRYGGGYIRRSDSREWGRTTIWMHRVILERKLNRRLASSEQVDHMNGNRLDNRRDNLRVADRYQNTRNRKRQSNNTSGFTGVIQRKTMWWSQIRVNSKRIHLGTYHTKEDAAIAYNHAALRYFGEFARFNEVPNWQNIKPKPSRRKNQWSSAQRAAPASGPDTAKE